MKYNKIEDIFNEDSYESLYKDEGEDIMRKEMWKAFVVCLVSLSAVFMGCPNDDNGSKDPPENKIAVKYQGTFQNKTKANDRIKLTNDEIHIIEMQTGNTIFIAEARTEGSDLYHIYTYNSPDEKKYGWFLDEDTLVWKPSTVEITYIRINE